MSLISKGPNDDQNGPNKDGKGLNHSWYGPNVLKNGPNQRVSSCRSGSLEEQKLVCRNNKRDFESK